MHLLNVLGSCDFDKKKNAKENNLQTRIIKQWENCIKMYSFASL